MILSSYIIHVQTWHDNKNRLYFTWFGGGGADGGEHLSLLLIISTAEQLTFLEHKLVTPLEPALALAAAEAAQVIHLPQHTHDQLWAANHLQARAALPHKQPKHTHTNQKLQDVCWILKEKNP